MKKILLFSFVIFSIFITGCKVSPFSLDDEYYKNSSFNELSVEEFDDLIKEKKTFAIFIYQPLCTASYEFNKVLTEFSNNNQISFYKMSYDDMKKTKLKEHVKYYPSMVIYHDGKLVDYLDANNDNHSEYYKSVEGFNKWFSKYVLFEKKDNNNNPTIDVEVDSDMKIDAKLDNVIYNENKVNIYFFWGNGCPHCEEEFKFFDSIETEYGDYFTLNTFEVWYDEENENILNQFANAMNDNVTGVPYTIIGNKSFIGFSEKYENQILQAIKEQYKNSYDVYFDNIN